MYGYLICLLWYLLVKLHMFNLANGHVILIWLVILKLRIKWENRFSAGFLPSWCSLCVWVNLKLYVIYVTGNKEHTSCSTTNICHRETGMIFLYVFASLIYGFIIIFLFLSVTAMVTSKVGKRHALTGFEALKELFIQRSTSVLWPDCSIIQRIIVHYMEVT